MRDKLQLQSDRVEDLLDLRGAPGYVVGAIVTHRWIRFKVAPDRITKVDAIKRLNQDIAAALGARNVRITQCGALVYLEIPRPNPDPVRLMPLFEKLNGRSIPPVTPMLGLDEEDAPLLIQLPSPDVAHVLIAGTTGSGKTVLLRTMILSLAIRHDPRELALILIDPRGGQSFDCFAAFRHRVWAGGGVLCFLYHWHDPVGAVDVSRHGRRYRVAVGEDHAALALGVGANEGVALNVGKHFNPPYRLYW